MLRAPLHSLLIARPMLFLVCLRRQQAQAALTATWSTVSILKQAVHYCVQLPATTTPTIAKRISYPVLYFLHGLGTNEQTIFSTGGWSLIEDLRRQHKIATFLIVAPGRKAHFYINSADNSFVTAIFFFRNSSRKSKRKYRVRAGRQSAGHHRSLHGRIRGVAIRLCPSRTVFRGQRSKRCPDHSNSAGILRRRTLPTDTWVELLGAAFGEPIDLPHWQQNSVFILARKNQSGLRNMAIYFNCGQQDDFGFEDGAAALISNSTQKHKA